jgi:hypothetical protein
MSQATADELQRRLVSLAVKMIELACILGASIQTAQAKASLINK